MYLTGRMYVFLSNYREPWQQRLRLLVKLVPRYEIFSLVRNLSFVVGHQCYSLLVICKSCLFLSLHRLPLITKEADVK